MDIAQLAGLDYMDIPLAGATRRVGELTLREWAPVQAWIKATVPGPLSSLESPDFKNLSPEMKRNVLFEALEQDRTSWPPRIGSKGWFASLDHEGGHAVLLLALLGKHSPSITLEECDEISREATNHAVVAAVCCGLGIIGPKSPPPAARGATRRAARKNPTS